MPTLFRERGYRFFFYSEEGFEPCHVHVIGHGGEAKFWIPSCELVRSYNMNQRQIGLLREILKDRRKEIEERWRDYFGR